VIKELEAPSTDDARQWLLLNTSVNLLDAEVELGIIYDVCTTDQLIY